MTAVAGPALGAMPSAGPGEASRHLAELPRSAFIKSERPGGAALTAIGVLLATWPDAGRFGVLLTGFAVAVVSVEVGVIALARGSARRAADEADPRAILALRDLLYPQATGPRTVEDQHREAQRQLRRIATLLDRNNHDAR
jgi:hypothetical protein